jgi:hypothetical protein
MMVWTDGKQAEDQNPPPYYLAACISRQSKSNIGGGMGRRQVCSHHGKLDRIDQSD